MSDLTFDEIMEVCQILDEADQFPNQATDSQKISALYRYMHESLAQGKPVRSGTFMGAKVYVIVSDSFDPETVDLTD